MHAELPLHQAVLSDDVAQIAALIKDSCNLFKKNHEGLTAVELAQFLGKKNSLRIFGTLPRSINIQLKGKDKVEQLTLEEYRVKLGINYTPWIRFENYEQMKKVRQNCPWLLRWKWSGKENQELGQKYQQQISIGYTAPLFIKWINEQLGYGLFAAEDIDNGAFIGEYSGLIRRVYRRHPQLNDYCFQYPSKYWSWCYFVVDAQHEGNYLRFANHSDRPNLQPQTAVDRGWLHQLFFANRKISKGTQLTFDYGEDYWQRRKKIQIREMD